MKAKDRQAFIEMYGNIPPDAYKKMYDEAYGKKSGGKLNGLINLLTLLLVLMLIGTLTLVILGIKPQEWIAQHLPKHDPFVQENIIEPQQTARTLPQPTAYVPIQPQSQQEPPAAPVQVAPQPVAPVVPAQPVVVPTQVPVPVQEAPPAPPVVVPTAIPQLTAVPPTKPPDTPYEALGQPMVDAKGEPAITEPQPTKFVPKFGYCEGC